MENPIDNFLMKLQKELKIKVPIPLLLLFIIVFIFIGAIIVVSLTVKDLRVPNTSQLAEVIPSSGTSCYLKFSFNENKLSDGSISFSLAGVSELRGDYSHMINGFFNDEAPPYFVDFYAGSSFMKRYSLDSSRFLIAEFGGATPAGQILEFDSGISDFYLPFNVYVASGQSVLKITDASTGKVLGNFPIPGSYCQK